MAAAASRRRQSGVSVVRIALIIGILGVVIILGWSVWFFGFDQASRRQPFEVQVYPGAEYWGENEVLTGSRNLFYRTQDLPEAVANFYQDKLNEHYGNRQEICVRIPPEGVMPGSENDATQLPYQFTCVFDRSGFNATQYTQVIIHPGRFNSDPFLNAEGTTVIKYEQIWQP